MKKILKKPLSEQLCECIDYYEKVGYFPCPKKEEVGDDFLYLCWRYKKNMLHRYFNQAFEETFGADSMFWEVLTTKDFQALQDHLRWQYMLGVLDRYLKKHAKLPAYQDEVEGEYLKDWLTNQCFKWRQNSLKQGRIDRLVKIGITSPYLITNTRKENQEKKWEQQFLLYQKTIDCPKSLEYGEIVKMNTWLSNQRRLLQTGKLGEKRKKALASVNKEFAI